MPKCFNCKKKTSNPKFCSRSCAAIVNNKLSPKRANTFFCIVCKERCLPKRKFCAKCWSGGKDITLSQAIYKHHHKSSAFALVRTRARSTVADLPKICSKCGYDKHVEICHKMPISSFPLNTLLSVINNTDNLLLLCPNCHWEFDNGA